MKKIIAIALFLGIVIISSVAQAKDSNFLSPDWWENATPQMVENEINNGADVKDRDEYGETPLMYAAAFNQNPEIIETLIKHGTDVKEKDIGGKTALDYAKANPNIYQTDAYKLLKDKMDE